MVYRTTQLPDPAEATASEMTDLLRVELRIGDLVALIEQVCDRGERQRRVGLVALEKLQTASMWCSLAVTTKSSGLQ